MSATVYQWGEAGPLNFANYQRLVVWFSCGTTSACAARLALDLSRDAGIETVVAYIDTGSEHEDNARFAADVERWIGRDIVNLKNPKYADIWAVFERERYIAGIAGARCTKELKKAVREAFERDGDLQVFGFDAGEMDRVYQYAKNQPEVALWCPLVDACISKDLSFHIVQQAGIELPAMYRLGYRNNNCIGCVKGGAGYWNKIRRDFPAVFDRMAKLERELGAKLVQATIDGRRQRVHLDELPLTAGRHSDDPPMSCGLLCQQPVEIAV